MAADPERTEQNIRQNTKIQYHFETIQITDENRFEVMERVSPFHEQLALAKGRTLKELFHNVDVGGEAVFAVTEGPEARDVGVVVGRLKPVIWGGRIYRMYIRYLRAVSPDDQDEGVGTEMTNQIVERLWPDGFEGRTPNPFIYRADERSPYIGIIHPIHKLHNIKTATLLASTLDDTYKEKLDFRTGRCEGVYPPDDPSLPEDEHRLFSLRRASERVLAIHRIMTTPPIGADLKNGDGTIYLEWVLKKKFRNSDPAA